MNAMDIDHSNQSSPEMLLDSREEIEAVSRSILDDLKVAIINSPLSFLLLLSIVMFFLYQIVIAPYTYQLGSNPNIVDSHDKLKYVRPVFSDEEINEIHTNLKGSETTLWLPHPVYDIVKLRHFEQVDEHGNFELPEFFYDGVIFGLTSESSHNTEYANQISLEERSQYSLDNLYSSLENMNPKPTSVMKRSSRNNSTGWLEDGVAVYFSLSDLQKQGRLSSDVMYPWKRTVEPVLKIARQFRQAYVFLWFPYRFGKNSPDDSPHKFQNIIQQIRPTRTGYNGIKSDVVVWLSALNYTTLQKQTGPVQKPWTTDDHWSMYKNNKTSISDSVQKESKKEL